MIKQTLQNLANQYSSQLQQNMLGRVEEMKTDDKSHYLIYQVLGISVNEGELIDIYQNKGRFLYQYAGAFLEEATFSCFKEKFPQARTAQVPNSLGQRPKQFEIDCLVNLEAIEIKWRDATTDGDHITKEHTRLQATKAYGYKPIRVMFYYPNRKQAARVQATLKTLYEGIGGEYYSGEAAWSYVFQRTGIDLKQILQEIADTNAGGNYQ